MGISFLPDGEENQASPQFSEPRLFNLRGNHEKVSVSSLLLSTVAISEQMSLSTRARSALRCEGEVTCCGQRRRARHQDRIKPLRRPVLVAFLSLPVRELRVIYFLWAIIYFHFGLGWQGEVIRKIGDSKASSKLFQTSSCWYKRKKKERKKRVPDGW